MEQFYVWMDRWMENAKRCKPLELTNSPETETRRIWYDGAVNKKKLTWVWIGRVIVHWATKRIQRSDSVKFNKQTNMNRVAWSTGLGFAKLAIGSRVKDGYRDAIHCIELLLYSPTGKRNIYIVYIGLCPLSNLSSTDDADFCCLLLLLLMVLVLIVFRSKTRECRNGTPSTIEWHQTSQS